MLNVTTLISLSYFPHHLHPRWYLLLSVLTVTVPVVLLVVLMHLDAIDRPRPPAPEGWDKDITHNTRLTLFTSHIHLPQYLSLIYYSQYSWFLLLLSLFPLLYLY